MSSAKDWISPTVIVAVVTIGVVIMQGEFSAQSKVLADSTRAIEDRVENTHSRIDAANSRIDTVLDRLTDMADRQAKMESDLTYVRNQTDKISEKLDVALVPMEGAPAFAYGHSFEPGGFIERVKILKDSTAPTVEGQLYMLKQSSEGTDADWLLVPAQPYSQDPRKE